MQKIIDTGKVRLLPVQLPEEAQNIYVHYVGRSAIPHLRYWIDLKDSCKAIVIPRGNWQILDRANQITEEQMEDICQEIIIRSEVPTRASGYLDIPAYKDYESDNDYKQHYYEVKQSYHSLLAAHQIQPDDLILIEKR